MFESNLHLSMHFQLKHGQPLKSGTTLAVSSLKHPYFFFFFLPNTIKQQMLLQQSNPNIIYILALCLSVSVLTHICWQKHKKFTGQHTNLYLLEDRMKKVTGELNTQSAQKSSKSCWLIFVHTSTTWFNIRNRTPLLYRIKSKVSVLPCLLHLIICSDKSI